MVEINIDYLGGLRCSAVHKPSGDKLLTDAPVDNMGKGEAFSPTDLTATSLGACALTIMGIIAQSHDVNLEGAKVKVLKEMTKTGVRRIEKLTVNFELPNTIPADKRQLFEAAIDSCPVRQSIHPDIIVEATFKYV